MSPIPTTRKTLTWVSRYPVERNTLSRVAHAVVSVCTLVALSGCSFFLAGVEGRDAPPEVHVGTTRAEVEEKLGSPAIPAARMLPEGGRVDIYEYWVARPRDPDAPSAYLAWDVLTFGFGEIIGTPSELLRLYRGQKFRIEVTYGLDDRVTATSYEPVPRPEP